MSDFHGVFGLWKIDGYRACEKILADTFRFEGRPGSLVNFITFPYDWRRSNREAAARLKVLVDEKLHQWRDFSCFRNAKVILLAHSMGGLVARYYLEVLEGWNDCRALVTFGTPYWGAIDTINYVANGYKSKLVELTEVIRSFPSVYELMACYDVVRVNGAWKKVAHAGSLPNVDAARATDALAFHNEIADAVVKNRNNPVYREHGYKIIPMIGTRQDTLQSVVLDAGRLIAVERRPPSVDVPLEGGDGRVPRVSAAPVEIFGEYRESFFIERHGSLQNNPQLLDDLVERLTQMQAHKPVRGTFEERSLRRSGAIALRVEDLYLGDEPVGIEVALKDREGGGALVVTVEGVTDRTRSFSEAFEIKAAEHASQLEIGTLGSGRYRVTVRAKEGFLVATPVRDVFEVAEKD
jgi:pimeloyl-ACP methyl ester carboxylesterase